MLREAMRETEAQEETVHWLTGWFRRHERALNRAGSVVLAVVVAALLWNAYVRVIDRKARRALTLRLRPRPKLGQKAQGRPAWLIAQPSFGGHG